MCAHARNLPARPLLAILSTMYSHKQTSDMNREPDENFQLDEAMSMVIEGTQLPEMPEEPVEKQDQNEKAEITLYGALLLSVESAVDMLRGYTLTARANAFRSFLIDLRNRLRK